MPRAKKRPSNASNLDSADSPKRSRKGDRAAKSAAPRGDPAQLLPLFPLPVSSAIIGAIPTPNAGTVESLEAAYGGVTFPKELLHVYDFCASRAAAASQSGPGCSVAAFKSALAPLGLEPCGPFDYLLCSEAPPPPPPGCDFDWLVHCRYAHDPPEFLTLFAAIAGAGGDELSAPSELHIGYVRDAPELLPAFLAANDAAKGGAFSRLAEGIFQSFVLHAKKRSKSLSQKQQQAQAQLLADMAKFCRQRGISASLEEAAAPSAALKQRDKATVARTLNGLGLSVPVSAEDEVGYRELPESDADLRRILSRVAVKCDTETDVQARLTLLEPVDELVTLVHFANDEGDTGMGLELGLDLLSVPSTTGCYDDLVESLLATGYGLLGRRLYADIVRRHMRVRRRYRPDWKGGESKATNGTG